ncbi:TIGR01777 family oxidoreductase [Amycolatopsis jejuensis]|uniref:TIGR01777 family oxidoreductase n=1 Tax=Amycolatopsis jejuensis TaxID=330084 RepID=UPI00052778FA|nr:TIGR01777 family oxidoreductase [Amycolatopsis jejuensis]
MRIVIAGSSGLIGTALRRSWAADGHTVIRLVRRNAAAPDERFWDPTGSPDPGLLSGADVVVNLAGAGLGARRWTRAYREVLRHSRIGPARALAEMTARADPPPRIMLAASGMRYYGVDRGDRELTESDDPGRSGFLPAITREWEAATDPAAIPVCHLRMGLVLAQDGGVLTQLLPLFRRGLGARLGTGREFWSYTGLTDAVRAIRHLAELPSAQGPYNITTPDPVRSAEFTRTLAEVLGRRALLRVPTWALRLSLGDVAPEVLGSLRVLPTRLTEAGFGFTQPHLHQVLRHELRPG